MSLMYVNCVYVGVKGGPGEMDPTAVTKNIGFHL